MAALSSALSSSASGAFAPSSASAKRRALRRSLAKEVLIQTQSVWDPLSARMAEDYGYEILVLAGSTASACILGSPDLALATLSEMAALVRRIARLSRGPLVSLEQEDSAWTLLSTLGSPACESVPLGPFPLVFRYLAHSVPRPYGALRVLP